MVEKRRYHIGFIGRTNSEIMLAKLKKQMKLACLVCLSAWIALTLLIIPTSRLAEKTLIIYSEGENNESSQNTRATNENGYLASIRSKLRDVIKPKKRFIIKYYDIDEQTKKGNLVPLNGVNNTDMKKARPTDKKGMGIFVPGSLPKFRIHDADFVKDQPHNDTERENPLPLPPSPNDSIGLRLTNFLTTPTTTCRRLVRIGGRSCLGAYDGSKLVCMDEDVKPQSMNCLVYSFGVGNDFTFDYYMQDYGCEVHSFDHDNDHEIYDFRQGPDVYFHKARIGVKEGYFKTCEMTQYGLDCQPSLRYHTMDRLRRILGHETRKLDYFKMDIEGAEWLVLGDVIHNSTMFTYTKQIALEIHMDDLRYKPTVEEKKMSLTKYLNIFQSLKQLGFHVAAYEENEVKPMYAEGDGITMSIYAEVLLLKKEEPTEQGTPYRMGNAN